MVLLPLSKKVSRGDQIANAKYACDRGFSKMILEEELNEEHFVDIILEMYRKRDIYKKRLNTINVLDAIDKQIKCINQWAK